VIAHRNRARDGSPRSAGFTLLEVMVATALLGMAAVGLLALINQSLRNATLVAEYDRAAMWARSTMDELFVVESLPVGREMSGELAAASVDSAGWRAVAEPWEVPPGGPVGQSMLVRIALEVWWESGGERERIELEGFRRLRIGPDMDINERRPNELI